MTTDRSKDEERFTAEIVQPDPLQVGTLNVNSPAGQLHMIEQLGDAAADRSSPKRRRNARILAFVVLIPFAFGIVLPIADVLLNLFN